MKKAGSRGIENMILGTFALLAFGADAMPTQSTTSVECTCPTMAAAPQPVLYDVQTAYASVPNSPFGPVYATLQKNIAFITLPGSLADPASSVLGVLNTSTFPPFLQHQLPFPPSFVSVRGAFGVALTRNGRYLFVAAGPGAVIFDTELAAVGHTNAVIGTLNGTTAEQSPGENAILVTMTNDGKYAFISQEYGNQVMSRNGNVDVIQVEYTASGLVTGDPIGFTEVEGALIGTSLSPDETVLYVVGESGFITTLNTTRLKTNGNGTEISRIKAGCTPVRTLVSADGEVLWVTARGENKLLGFNTSVLRSADLTPHGKNAALLASVEVGSQPVGLAFVQNEARIITADSSRFIPNGTTGLSVVDVNAALQKNPCAVLGQIPTGQFPREFAVSPDGLTLLVSDFDSHEVQVVNVSTIP